MTWGVGAERCKIFRASLSGGSCLFDPSACYEVECLKMLLQRYHGDLTEWRRLCT